MYNLLKSEIYRLKHMLSFKIFIIILSLVPLIMSFAMLIALRNDPEVDPREFTGAVALAAGDSGNMIILFVIILSGLYICGEFASRNIAVKIAAGHSRKKILLAKLLTLFLATAFLHILPPFFAAIIPTIVNGFGAKITVVWPVLRSLLLCFPLILAIVAISVLIGFKLKKTGIVISTSLAFILLGDMIFQLLAALFPYPAIEKLYKYSILGNYEIACNPVITSAQILHVLLVAIVTTAVFLSLTWTVFRKDEIK